MFFKLYSNQDPNKVHTLCWLTHALNSFYSKGSPFFSLRHPLQLTGCKHSHLPRGVCSGLGGPTWAAGYHGSLACTPRDLEAGSGGVGRRSLISRHDRLCAEVPRLLKELPMALLHRPLLRPAHWGACLPSATLASWFAADFCNEEGPQTNHLLTLTVFKSKAGQVPDSLPLSANF